jgi:hypothetical protein
MVLEYMVFKLPSGKLRPRLPFYYSSLPNLTPKLEKWARVLEEDARLEDGGEFGEYHIVKFKGTCNLKKPPGAITVPKAYLFYDIWVKDNPPFACCFSPKYVAYGLMILYSQATYGRPDRFLDLRIEREQYLRMVDLILNRNGKVNWLAVRGVRAGGTRVRRIEMIGPEIHQMQGFRESLENPEVTIQKMGFRLEHLSWTLANWGGGQLSSPQNPENADLLRFLDILEKVLFQHQEST